MSSVRVKVGMPLLAYLEGGDVNIEIQSNYSFRGVI